MTLAKGSRKVYVVLYQDIITGTKTTRVYESLAGFNDRPKSMVLGVREVTLEVMEGDTLD